MKDLYISNAGDKGRGVFAGRRFAEDEIVEKCPVLVLNMKGSEAELYDQLPKLWNYIYYWGKDDKELAIALGYGSLYNHSNDPNVGTKRHPESEEIWIIALRDIEEDEELVHDYGWTSYPWDKSSK